MMLRAFWLHKRHQRELMEQNHLLEQQRDTEKALNEQLNVATQSKLIFLPMYHMICALRSRS